MRNKIQFLVFLLAFIAMAQSTRADDLSSVRFNRPVIDLAKMLSQNELRVIEQELYQLKKSTGTQIGVITLNSLDGDVIEQVSIKIAEKWQLGDKKLDDGILITVAKADRKMRIEVGQGHEGNLPDAYAKRIIDQRMTPAFKSGQFAVGILGAIHAIVEKTNPDYVLSSGQPQARKSYRSSRSSGKSSPISKVITILFILFLIFTPMGRVILMAMLLSGGRGGGGFGGGGGGGYSGGGGGFSGGGASGGW